MPFNIWCLGCNKQVAKSVRFNAEKKHIDNYFSTPVFSFSMQCHICSNIIEIQTDPKNAEYVVSKGGRRKVEEWQPEMNETLELTDSKDAEKIAKNPFFKLEHVVDDKRKAAEALPKLESLKRAQNVWKDDYTASKILRQQLREDKKIIEIKKKEADVIRQHASFNIPILPEAEEDIEKAKSICFKNQKGGISQLMKKVKKNSNKM